MTGEKKPNGSKQPNWDALRSETKRSKKKKKKKKFKNRGSVPSGPTESDEGQRLDVENRNAELVTSPEDLKKGAPEPISGGPAVVKASNQAADSTIPTEKIDKPAKVRPVSPVRSGVKLEKVEGKTELPRVIVVANQKGGVGKTTTTVSVAACVAEAGYRTLVVDLDPQANASTGLGLNPHAQEASVYHALFDSAAAEDIIEPSEVENLFVLPSSLDLAGAEIELVPAMSREHRLKKAIESVIDDYDYVFIDCPPSLGLLTINALTAASEVLVPIQCEYYALEGLGQLMNMVELVQGSLNEALRISHIVLVMFDSRTRLGGQVVDEVRAHFGDLVCRNVIPRTVRLSEAPSFGQPITIFDPESTGAMAYRAVAEEVMRG